MLSKSKLIQTFGPFGGYAFARWLMRNDPRIVMYHRFSAEPRQHCVSADVLEQQILYVKKHFNVIPLSQLRACKEQGVQPPKNSLVLTVDDGYRDFYEVAYPLLKKHSIPATLFVTTGFINQELWLWPDQITWLLAQSPALNEDVPLSNTNGESIKATQVNDQTRPKLWGQVISCLLSINDQEKHAWIQKFASVLNLALPNQAPEEYQACSWRELKEMQSNGIEIGGHTHTHPSMGQIDHKQLAFETQYCKEKMSDNLGEQERDFCYPNGQPNDYNEQVKLATKEAGFKSAVTAFYDGLATTDLFEMRRHTASDEWFQFYKSVNGVEAFMAKYQGSHNKMDVAFC